jgi:hypothetical protein
VFIYPNIFIPPGNVISICTSILLKISKIQYYTLTIFALVPIPFLLLFSYYLTMWFIYVDILAADDVFNPYT